MKLLPLALWVMLSLFCQQIQAQANKGKPVSTAASGSNNASAAMLTMRTKVDSLRKTGKDNDEIFQLLKSTTPTKVLLSGLKKTQPRIKAATPTGSSRV